ncbi:MAG TPA: hypothetical protein VMX54_13590 [Vicinamibacteria bacterium]|nr:hypothetical protein [Vicinamibacteria bacterium]
MVARASLLALWLASAPVASAPAASPDPVTVVAAASKPEVGVGEAFTLELKASGPPGTAFTFPREAVDDTLELRAEQAGSPPPAGVHRYRAAVFTLGEAEIPEIPVGYRLPDGRAGQARSQPLKLRVVSVLPKDPQQQRLADIRGPLPVAIGLVFWVALVAAVLVAAAGATWLVRRRRAATVTPAAAVPPAPPEEEARRALDALAASRLLERGEYRAFYIRLTEVAKRYLERRLDAPVLEMTTAETLAFLRRHPAGDALVSPLREVAEAADRIKFARGEGLAAEAERHLSSARGMVSDLEQRLRPAEPPVAGRAA